MDAATRQVVTIKLGTLVLANAELAAENSVLRKLLAERDQRIAALQSELESLQQGAQRPAGPTDRHEGAGDNLPANPYNGTIQ
jgi:hypothetical protein